MNVRLDTSVTAFPGVGAARANSLAKLGIKTAGDLLNHYPREYEDRREVWNLNQAPADKPVCIYAMVAELPSTSRIRKGLEVTRVRVVDVGGSMTVTFFNQSYVREALRPGESYIFYGIVEMEGWRRRMTNPVFEPEARRRFTGCIMPVYPLTAGIGNNFLAELIRQAMPAVEEWRDCLPRSLRESNNLIEARRAIKDIHFPQGFQELEQARRRMIFEELFILTAGLSLLKNRRKTSNGPKFALQSLEEFLKLLPFAPTEAQRRVMEEVVADVEGGPPMNRLIQGDVGSGKTTVAAFGAWIAWKSGWQTALMVPTEILAEQHHRSLTGLLSPTGMRVALLTGKVKGTVKKKLLEEIGRGDYHLIVGTHALLSQGVEYAHLGLVVADEQHRFGVAQRAVLAAKAGKLQPHVLVMSATPIPRTLALIIYGDLDISIVDELPPGRTSVQTFLVGEDKRERMYGFVRKLTAEGRQTYIVCPAVEESQPGEDMDLKAVTQYSKNLQEKVFPDLRVGLIHGKLKGREKDAVMSAFARGEMDILVSTTVIEVGVDVPNAALMIVENAERFGLSQLHQLRGRVGRGVWQSYCILVTDTRREDSLTRLKVMTTTNDGFQIAEEDLKLRGPGDFFGQRQHGLPTLRLADLAKDMLLLREAQDAAKELIADDPALSRPEHCLLLERVRQLFMKNPDIFN